MTDLVALARRYVALSDELEEVRGAIKRAVVNGAAGDAAARPTSARRAPGRQHPNTAKAVEAETKILELIKDHPMRTAQLAEATGAPPTTVIMRLKRLRSKGMVRGGGNAGWQASGEALG